MLSFENEKLFARSVPISMKDVYTKQSRTSHLIFTMEWQDGSEGTYGRKVLVISLTDNNDPFFLYNLHLSEEDFQMLKNSQGLLIDFPSFPQHIIDYIDKCLREEKNPQPKFLLLFTVNDKLGNLASPSQLDIIETNDFKHLTHLSLKFIAATESAVRQYLGKCFRNLKEENQQQRSRLAFIEQDLKDKLSLCQHTLNTKVQELAILRKEKDTELSIQERNYTIELKEERDRLFDRLKNEKSVFEKEMRETEHHFCKQIHQLEARVSCLDALNKELQDKLYKSETKIKKIQSDLLSSEEEIRRLKGTCQNYKQKMDNMHSELKDKVSQNRHLDEKVSRMSLELQNKGHNILRLEKHIENDSQEKKYLEDELAKTKREFTNFERKENILTEECVKLKEIIKKLQQKLKAGTEKVKSKSELSSRQEREIEEKEKFLKQLEKKSVEMNCLIEAKSHEIKQLNETVNSLQNKVVNCEKELKDKENVINYLQRQLTEKVFNEYTPPANIGPSPSSVAQKQLIKISGGRKSTSPDTSPALAVPNSTVPKTAKKVTMSNRRSCTTPSRHHRTDATDSAYCTPPTGQFMPDDQYTHKNLHFYPSEFDVDPSAFSAAFRSEDNPPKHSTAKKQMNPAKSTIPKLTRR